MSELSNENKEQEKDKQQQPAVGPDSNFSQKVLSSFEREPLTPEEIKKKQRKWKKYTDTRNFLSISMQVFLSECLPSWSIFCVSELLRV